VTQFDFPDDLGMHLGRILSDVTGVMDLGVQTLRYGQTPLREVSCDLAMTPRPNPDSRVVLLDEVDRLGLPRVALDWRLTAQDKRSALYTVEAFGREIGRLGLGRVRSHLVDDDHTWPDDLVGAWHHIGTTRMSEEPNTGVVDRHCRVHRVDNLFVAGSSVFADAGDGTPTLMIITLAARLAARLKEHLA
jgi:choline dehydrogenase-like flavoprotein